jgi:hypothetical protein
MGIFGAVEVSAFQGTKMTEIIVKAVSIDEWNEAGTQGKPIWQITADNGTIVHLMEKEEDDTDETNTIRLIKSVSWG